MILPTLGPDRRATYSPILPIHPRTGRVMQVKLDGWDAGAGTVAWCDPDTGEAFETSVRGGACKLQWKADWAMRWFALGVDYEMSGKDLIETASACRAASAAFWGPDPPAGFRDELFLDEHAQKISKSQGQRPLRRGMAALRAAGNPARPVHVQRAPAGEAAVFRRDPKGRGRRGPANVARFVSAGRRRPGGCNAAWHIHGGRRAEGSRKPHLVRHAPQPGGAW